MATATNVPRGTFRSSGDFVPRGTLEEQGGLARFPKRNSLPERIDLVFRKEHLVLHTGYLGGHTCALREVFHVEHFIYVSI